ncbi:DUF2141 domain-containing protein [Verrucomicrobiales bacterium]|nr:DUF2141 domain-containing protein [Verrucomicrobiales bacterium]MDC0276719.1 DUF2141 domain-containing protein [Verrucomicrobiales bacterium]
MKTAMKALTVTILLLLSQGLIAGELSVVVKGITTPEGTLMVGIFDSKKTFKKDAIDQSTKDAVIEAGEMTIVVKDLKPGIYAFIAFHDLNENLTCDIGKWGIPTEPVAFSNEPKMRFGPPSFKACSFTVTDETPVKLEVTLQSRK